MRAITLKSYQFRREREAGWRELEDLLHRAEKHGVTALWSDELMRLPRLYRAALSSLSVARTISLDRNVVRYLESLTARGYLAIYGTRTTTLAMLAAFFVRSLPNAVRGAWRPILLAAATLAFGLGVGFALTLADPANFYQISSENSRTLARTAEFLRSTLYEGHIDEGHLAVFASFLFSHNARIGLMAFALGIVFGLPVLLLLFANGVEIGALAAVFHSRGLSVELWGWLLIHGTTELLAVVLCGGAGLVLGSAVAFPGAHSRLAMLRLRGRAAATIVLGAALMFLIAGLLEGFARQLVQDTATRYAVALTMLALWLVYFGLAGRRR